MSKLIPIACLALLGTAGPAWADQAQESTSSSGQRPDQGKIQQVNVSGARADDTESRRLSTAAQNWTAMAIPASAKS